MPPLLDLYPEILATSLDGRVMLDRASCELEEARLAFVLGWREPEDVEEWEDVFGDVELLRAA